MQKLQFKIAIKAPVTKVYDIMLGLSHKSTYEQWTKAFNPTSTYEGSWDKGQKMLFIGTDENGNKGGMISEVAENIPHQFVSIRHYGMIKDNVEVTSGPDVEKWANGYENYTFTETQGVTEVRVELDVVAEFLDYMNETYPKALEELKALCE